MVSGKTESRARECTPKDGPMERKKRYNKDFVAFIERSCRESGAVFPVDEDFYESFVALTDEYLVFIVRYILCATAKTFNKYLFSNAWKSDDEMYEFVMTFLELIAEGKVGFNDETGKMLFASPSGDPPSDEMWAKIQKRIGSSRSAIRKAIVKNVQGRS